VAATRTGGAHGVADALRTFVGGARALAAAATSGTFLVGH
jgi:hypothetical protein